MESTSAEAMSRCSRICRNDGRFRGLLFLDGMKFGGERHLREVQEGIRAPFPKVCSGPGESNPRMFAVTKGFPGQLARTCYNRSVVHQSPAVRKPI